MTPKAGRPALQRLLSDIGAGRLDLVVLYKVDRLTRQSGNDSLTEIADAEGVSQSYFTRLVRLAFLSPEIVAAILDGEQPADLTTARLSRLTRLPLAWSEERKALGFS